MFHKIITVLCSILWHLKSKQPEEHSQLSHCNTLFWSKKYCKPKLPCGSHIKILLVCKIKHNQIAWIQQFYSQCICRTILLTCIPIRLTLLTLFIWSVHCITSIRCIWMEDQSYFTTICESPRALTIVFIKAVMRLTIGLLAEGMGHIFGVINHLFLWCHGNKFQYVCLSMGWEGWENCVDLQLLVVSFYNVVGFGNIGALHLLKHSKLQQLLFISCLHHVENQ